MVKKKIMLWYADQIICELDEGRDLNSTKASLKLSVVKPLHTMSVIEMYDHKTPTDGKAVCLKG